MNTTTHEAAHVAGMIAACGFVPLEVRADRPDVQVLGRTTANWQHASPDRNYLIAVLMGPASQGEVIGWRPSGDGYGPGHDEYIAAVLVNFLDLAKHDYLDALATADYLLARDDVRAVIRLVAVALKQVPRLTERQLRELLGREWLEHFHIDQEGTTT